jgi:hypothetical protein
MRTSRGISFLAATPTFAAADTASKRFDHQPVEIEDQSRPWDFLTAAFLSFVDVSEDIAGEVLERAAFPLILLPEWH